MSKQRSKLFENKNITVKSYIKHLKVKNPTVKSTTEPQGAMH